MMRGGDHRATVAAGFFLLIESPMIRFRPASLVFACALLTACSPAAQQAGTKAPAEIDSFQACVAAGNPVMKTFPARCAARNGKIYTQEIVRTIEGRACKDQCGNGQCQQIVCQAQGCPCAETPVNCARDCVDPSF